MGKRRIGWLWAVALMGVLISGPVWGQEAAPTPQMPPIPAPTDRPVLPAPRMDPAEQIAPPVLELTPEPQPISQVLALTMHRELASLVGRFESAQLMTLAEDQPTPISGQERLSASTRPVPAIAASPVLVEAHDLLRDWFGLIGAQEFATARDRWEQVRQSLWSAFPRVQPLSQPEIRAVWLDRGTIVKAGDPEGLAQVFDRLQRMGFNTVFFETVNAGFTIYPSRLTSQNPLTVRWDPLKAAVALAHERDMELHAWVWTLAAGNRVHNRILDFPEEFDGPVLALHPGWASYDNQGNTVPQGQTKPFYDPANQELRTFLLRLFSEIISNYDVDGLQLDYIRYPFQNPGANRTYGYGNDARWRFRAATGIDPIDLSPRFDPEASLTEQRQQRYLWDRWTEFRSQQVTTLVFEISQMVKRQRPDITLSAAVFAHPEHERLQTIQQNWGFWAEANYLDWVVLMSYAADTGQFEQLVTPWLVDRDFGDTLILPSIRLLNLPRHGALDQIQAARDLPAVGYAAFAAGDLTSELEIALAQTQPQEGLSLSGADVPYAMVLRRYQTLQREWSWLLSEGYLWVEQARRRDWIAQVNRLEATLKTLVDKPSGRSLAEARSQLKAVQTSITDSLAIGLTNSAYRIQTWRHRLTALE
ncbi:hypothetical protein C7271_22465, partial [filamentous cyanobacterium CCP5]